MLRKRHRPEWSGIKLAENAEDYGLREDSQKETKVMKDGLWA
jgi:hypothetical protein